MKRKSEEAIMAASKPSDIFSMNADTIEQEKEEYIESFKPKAYSTIKNFVVTQKVILLYRQALSELGDNEHNEYLTNLSLNITNLGGNTYNFICHYVYDIKIGKMYVTEDNIIFVINKQNKKYYENYVEKTKKFPKLDKNIWKQTEFMFPKVSKHFEDADGNWIIIIDKPCKIYPLREILNYYEGKLKPEYVASILTRLYYFECYMDLIGMNHNGITIDNLFFAPGRRVEEGESYTVHDMRIVGVIGGWFFTTWSDEKISGVPREVYESLPEDSKKTGYSSYKVDELSIKRIARELLGDITGKDLCNIPKSFLEWVNNSNPKKNAYEEFRAWEKVIDNSFEGHRFVEMDVSID